MCGVIARSSRRFEKIPVGRLLFEILHPPRSPERLQFFLWKFFHRYLRFRFPAGKLLAVPSPLGERWSVSRFSAGSFIRRKVEPACPYLTVSLRTASRMSR